MVSLLNLHAVACGAPDGSALQADALPQVALQVELVVIAEQLGVVYKEHICGRPRRRLHKDSNLAEKQRSSQGIGYNATLRNKNSSVAAASFEQIMQHGGA